MSARVKIRGTGRIRITGRTRPRPELPGQTNADSTVRAYDPELTQESELIHQSRTPRVALGVAPLLVTMVMSWSVCSERSDGNRVHMFRRFRLSKPNFHGSEVGRGKNTAALSGTGD